MKKKAVYLLAVAALLASAFMTTGCGADQANSNPDTKTETEGKADLDDSGLEINTSVFDSFKASDYVKLPDYKNLAVDVQYDDTITEDEVRKFVNTVCSYYPLANPDEKVVKNGDFVDIDYEGKKDGVAFEGGTAEGYILEIGSGNFIDGFESGLIGAKVGETVDLNLTFPENYQSAELAGADVVFTVKINGICYNYDTLTDEYVKGQFEETMNLTTVKDFIAKANESVKKDKDDEKNAAAREACAKKLTELSEVTLPDGLVDYRMDQYFKQFENVYLSSNGYTLENYVNDNLKMSMDEFRESERKTIEGELKQELALKAFAETENLEIDDEAFEAYVGEVVEANKMANADALFAAYETDLQTGEDYLRNRYYLIEAITKLMDYCDFNYVAGSED